MLFGPSDEATFVASDPPRAGYLALWSPESRAVDGEVPGLTVVTPAGSRLRRRRVPIRSVPVADAIDPLVDLAATAEVRPSVHAWATAARLVIDLVARGRILPGITPAGLDGWRLGPLDPADVARLDQMAAALPAPAHAVWLPGSQPLRVASPGFLVAAFADAIADALVRTAAAPTAAGHHAFAGRPSVDVTAAADWLASVGAGAREGTSTALRLVPPEPRGTGSEDHADHAGRGDPGRGNDIAGPNTNSPNTHGLDPNDEATDFGQTGEPFALVVQLQSRRDPSLVVDADDLWAAPDAVLARFGEDAETGLLLALRRGGRVWPPLTRLLDQARPGRLELSDGEVDDLLGPVTDDLAGAGLQVLWPVEVMRPIPLRPVISTPAPAAVTSAGLTLNSLMELRWRVALDGEELSEEELNTLAEAKRPLVRLRGRWVRADPERLARLRRRRSIPTATALAAALGGTLTIDGETVDAEIEGPLVGLAQRLRALDRHREPGEDPDGQPRSDRRERPPPAGLEAVLRPYQARGVAWLAEMADLGLGGILADDMGLGKTIQLLAVHLDRAARGLPTLVICPASVLGNWEREAHRFAPTLPVRRFHGASRSLEHLAAGEIVLATYGTARREVDALAAVSWGLVAADEAQAIKNPLSRTARTLRRLPASARFALTGTPVENRLTDLWAILDWTTPGLLGPLEQFRRDVAVPIERHRDEETSASLARLVRPFLLRRRKSDPAIAPELPRKTETDHYVPLTHEQATLYAAVAAETLDQIRGTEGIARRGLVLKLLTALKQICNHPAHYLGQASPLSGRSGKLDAAAELVDVIADEGDAALLFSQYVVMGRLLVQHLSERGIETLFLHGSLRLGQRQELVDRFQAGEAAAFVISLKAGGTGLNLTRATHVIHYDRWWNPAVEDQASDRAWRIGQDRPVQVHRLMCE
ncbi:MAG TPA: DEAD/DEAH box helicase, partial [Acidimicrobiales bacterium]|nr:DEAD/DEAH box helicase [Acidimicrobiales bacterium]